MWVIVPVKRLRNCKRRLSTVLDTGQRARFSRLLLLDVLSALAAPAGVQGITLVSSDPGLAGVARNCQADLLLLEKDSGYSEDVLLAIGRLGRDERERIAIIPSDVPRISPAEVAGLCRSPRGGITLCPAHRDAGTNALVFTSPLTIPLLFGKDSFYRHRQAAIRDGLEVQVMDLPGLARDIDRPEDLLWLASQAGGGLAWSYLREELRIAC